MFLYSADELPETTAKAWMKSSMVAVVIVSYFGVLLSPQTACSWICALIRIINLFLTYVASTHPWLSTHYTLFSWHVDLATCTWIVLHAEILTMPFIFMIFNEVVCVVLPKLYEILKLFYLVVEESLG